MTKFARTALRLLFAASLALPARAQSTLPEGEGRAIVADVCSQCHSLVYVTDTRRTAAQWQYIVSMMVALGAPLQPEEIGPVIDYLVKNLGPEDPGKAPGDGKKAARE